MRLYLLRADRAQGGGANGAAEYGRSGRRPREGLAEPDPGVPGRRAGYEKGFLNAASGVARNAAGLFLTPESWGDRGDRTPLPLTRIASPPQNLFEYRSAKDGLGS